MAKLRDSAQRIADNRIDELIRGTGPEHAIASETAFQSFANTVGSS